MKINVFQSIRAGVTAIAMSLSLVGAANAITLDLGAGTTTLSYDSAGPINSFLASSSGVDFTFTTAGQFRTIGLWSGGHDFTGGNPRVELGGGGGSPSAFTITASQDVWMSGFWGLAQIFNVNPIFDVFTSTNPGGSNTFSTAGFVSSNPAVLDTFTGGPMFVAAGSSLFIQVANNGSGTLGHITGLEFSTALPPVPVPAGLPLLLGGLGLFGFAKHRRKKAV